MRINLKFVVVFVVISMQLQFIQAQDVFKRYQCEVSQLGIDLSIPFTGGFNSPQLFNHDLNNDGSQDLIIFDRYGNVPLVFLFNDNSESFKYEYSQELSKAFIDFERWVICRDFNEDGIIDVFTWGTENNTDGIKLFKGQFNNGKLSFTEYPTANSENGLLYTINSDDSHELIFSSHMDKPEIKDIDLDGDLDILTFDTEGTSLVYYKNVSQELNLPSDSLKFIVQDPCWGKFAEASESTTISLSTVSSECASGFKGETDSDNRVHAGSTTTALDLNNDSTIDVLIGDIFSDKIKALFNAQGTDNAWFTILEDDYPQNDVPIDLFNFPAVYEIDFDNDNDLDLICAPNSISLTDNYSCMHIYENLESNGQSDFKWLQNDFLVEETIDLGSDTSPCFVDIDNDGLTDLVVGTSGIHDEIEGKLSKIVLYKNTGSPNTPKFELFDTDFMEYAQFSNESKNFAPCFGDLDNDGDLDAIVGDHTGVLYYSENISTESEIKFEQPVYFYFEIDVGAFSKPTLYDLDEDGDLDLFVGERNLNLSQEMVLGNINYFVNTGSNEIPHFEMDESQGVFFPSFGGINTRKPTFPGGSSAPILQTVGDSLYFISGSENSGLYVHLVDTSDITTPFEKLHDYWGDIWDGELISPSLSDIDSDGSLNLILGNRRGGLSMFETNISESGIINSSHLLSAENELLFYPNPTNDKVFIKNINSLDYNLEIYSSTMQKMGEFNSMDEFIDLQSFPSGIYFIISSQHQYNSKLIKF